MRINDHTIDMPLVVTDALDFRGLAKRGAVIRRGGKLILHGTIVGNLMVKPGGEAILHGTVNGTVSNEGGHVEIYGRIDGLISPPGAITLVGATAEIGDGTH